MKQVSIVAGGCFWGIEAVFSQIKGIEKTTSSYIGEITENPTFVQEKLNMLKRYDSVVKFKKIWKN